MKAADEERSDFTTILRPTLGQKKSPTLSLKIDNFKSTQNYPYIHNPLTIIFTFLLYILTITKLLVQISDTTQTLNESSLFVHHFVIHVIFFTLSGSFLGLLLC